MYNPFDGKQHYQQRQGQRALGAGYSQRRGTRERSQPETPASPEYHYTGSEVKDRAPQRAADHVHRFWLWPAARLLQRAGAAEPVPHPDRMAVWQPAPGGQYLHLERPAEQRPCVHAGPAQAPKAPGRQKGQKGGFAGGGSGAVLRGGFLRQRGHFRGHDSNRLYQH